MHLPGLKTHSILHRTCYTNLEIQLIDSHGFQCGFGEVRSSALITLIFFRYLLCKLYYNPQYFNQENSA